MRKKKHKINSNFNVKQNETIALLMSLQQSSVSDSTLPTYHQHENIVRVGYVNFEPPSAPINNN